jgi:hypothetical protein
MKDDKKNQVVRVLMTKDEKQQLYSLAKKNDVPVSQVVRGLIREAIKEAS